MGFVKPSVSSVTSFSSITTIHPVLLIKLLCLCGRSLLKIPYFSDLYFIFTFILICFILPRPLTLKQLATATYMRLFAPQCILCSVEHKAIILNNVLNMQESCLLV